MENKHKSLYYLLSALDQSAAIEFMAEQVLRIRLQTNVYAYITLSSEQEDNWITLYQHVRHCPFFLDLLAYTADPLWIHVVHRLLSPRVFAFRYVFVFAVYTPYQHLYHNTYEAKRQILWIFHTLCRCGLQLTDPEAEDFQMLLVGGSHQCIQLHAIHKIYPKLSDQACSVDSSHVQYADFLPVYCISSNQFETTSKPLITREDLYETKQSNTEITIESLLQWISQGHPVIDTKQADTHIDTYIHFDAPNRDIYLLKEDKMDHTYRMEKMHALWTKHRELKVLPEEKQYTSTRILFHIQGECFCLASYDWTVVPDNIKSYMLELANVMFQKLQQVGLFIRVYNLTHLYCVFDNGTVRLVFTAVEKLESGKNEKLLAEFAQVIHYSAQKQTQTKPDIKSYLLRPHSIPWSWYLWTSRPTDWDRVLFMHQILGQDTIREADTNQVVLQSVKSSTMAVYITTDRTNYQIMQNMTQLYKGKYGQHVDHFSVKRTNVHGLAMSQHVSSPVFESFQEDRYTNYYVVLFQTYGHIPLHKFLRHLRPSQAFTLLQQIIVLYLDLNQMSPNQMDINSLDIFISSYYRNNQFDPMILCRRVHSFSNKTITMSDALARHLEPFEILLPELSHYHTHPQSVLNKIEQSFVINQQSVLSHPVSIEYSLYFRIERQAQVIRKFYYPLDVDELPSLKETRHASDRLDHVHQLFPHASFLLCLHHKQEESETTFGHFDHYQWRKQKDQHRCIIYKFEYPHASEYINLSRLDWDNLCKVYKDRIKFHIFQLVQELKKHRLVLGVCNLACFSVRCHNSMDVVYETSEHIYSQDVAKDAYQTCADLKLSRSSKSVSSIVLGAYLKHDIKKASTACVKQDESNCAYEPVINKLLQNYLSTSQTAKNHFVIAPDRIVAIYTDSSVVSDLQLKFTHQAQSVEYVAWLCMGQIDGSIRTYYDTDLGSSEQDTHYYVVYRKPEKKLTIRTILGGALDQKRKQVFIALFYFAWKQYVSALQQSYTYYIDIDTVDVYQTEKKTVTFKSTEYNNFGLGFVFSDHHNIIKTSRWTMKSSDPFAIIKDLMGNNHSDQLDDISMKNKLNIDVISVSFSSLFV